MSATTSMNLLQRMGNPRTVCAPMVDASELPFRLLCRRYGTDLCYTPMYHARSFGSDAKYRKQFQTCAEDRPLIVQFCANDPQHLLAAARHVEGSCDAVDINLGCPQGIARRGNYGSFLLSQPELVKSLVEILHENLAIPVTCKIRVLPSADDTLRFAKMLQDAGCSILTVHGRTKEMNKDKVRGTDLVIIKRIKEELHIPVIANGSIEDVRDVRNCLVETGVDGVMSAEGILGNPSLFSGTHVDPLTLASEYLELVKQHPVRPKTVRNHLFKMLFRPLMIFTDLRPVLGKATLDVMMTFPDVLAQRIQAMGEDSYKQAYANTTSWYRRYTKRLDPNPFANRCDPELASFKWQWPLEGESATECVSRVLPSHSLPSFVTFDENVAVVAVQRDDESQAQEPETKKLRTQ